MIENVLNKIGLTEGEIQVYSALIELGQSTTGSITKKADIASSKVYEVLQRLIKKGLANYVLKNGVRYYDATPPERLIDFLDQKRKEIVEGQEQVRKILPELKSKRMSTKEKNETVVYSGNEGPKIALNEALEAGKSGEQLYGFGTDEDPYLQFFPIELERHFKEQKKHKVKWKMLFSQGFDSPNPLAEIRYLPKEFAVPVRTMIYGSKVAIVDFHKPFTTIIIEKKEIAENYKIQFNALWKIAKR